MLLRIFNLRLFLWDWGEMVKTLKCRGLHAQRVNLLWIKGDERKCFSIAYRT